MHRRRAMLVPLLALTTSLIVAALAPVASAGDSPLGDVAAPWPTAFADYRMADGTAIRDAGGDEGCGDGYCDLGSGVPDGLGTLSTVYYNGDGQNIFFRLRTVGDPADAGAGGFEGTQYSVAIGVNGTQVAVVGVDGKSSSADEVYVSNADGSQANTIYRYPFTDTSQGARAVADGGAGFFVDWQVPIARITEVAPSVTATTPIQLFYGTSQSNNRSVINKDYMLGNAVSFAGLGAVALSGGIEITSTYALVSGPNPPQAGATTVYELTITVTNRGPNPVGSLNITDGIPGGVTVVGTATSSGSIAVEGQSVRWQPAPVAPGATVTATVRVSVSPTATQVGENLPLDGGVTGEGTDPTTGQRVTDGAPVLLAGPVVQAPPSTDQPTPSPSPDPTASPGPLDATDDTVATSEDRRVRLAVLANDTGPLDLASVQVVAAPAHGTTIVHDTGEVTYIPAPGFAGTDTFTYQVCTAGAPAQCDVATVTVTVTPVEDLPDSGPISMTTPPGTPGTIDTLANDGSGDGDLDASSVRIVTPPLHGTATVDTSTGVITYTPSEGYTGADSLVYEVCDAGGRCDTALVTIGVGIDAAPPTAEIDRTAGDGRVQTAIGVSTGQFVTSAVAVLARADDYADALAGAPLSFSLSAPTLLTPREALDPAVMTELRRLGVQTVYLLGGEVALTPRVALDIAEAGLAYVRVGGANRFDTARLIAERLGGDQVFIAKGNDRDPRRGWADALSIGPVAARLNAPILLVESSRLPEETLAALRAVGPAGATVLGGTGAVDDGVFSAIAAQVADTSRLSGANRYATSAAIADLAVASGLDGNRVWLAQGDNWPDALAAGPTVAADNGVLLLVDGRDLGASPETAAWLEAQAGDLEDVHLLGGPAALDPAVEAQVRDLAG